ncbi:hypothetical protein CCB80_02170 [Armatimonadetes bacterium Uphvl-Ar1]|nr:hypothetical protein CCB80_02170 [Armatimonadetes bacterium Uphvl-Ar1]
MSDKNVLRQHSARSLVSLYTVIIGVSLTFGIAGLIDPKAGLSSISVSAIKLFLAYLATLFPFYHGALRHLDDAYFENPISVDKRGILIVDFCLLFLHALGFVVLSVLLKLPIDFAHVLLTILTIDVIWGFITYFGSEGKKSFNATLKWALLNFFAVGLGTCYLAVNGILFAAGKVPTGMHVVILVFALFRTVLDYIICGSFYFPREPEPAKD